MDSEALSRATAAVSSRGAPRSLGQYVMFQAIASGGMATLHLGRSRGAAGFARTVAIKRMQREYTSNEEFVAMFLDEARLAARINHPNVVSTLDVVMQGSELFLVMDYVHGEALGSLMGTDSEEPPTAVPPAIASAILFQALMGLEAAHEAKSDTGQFLGVVHRDVSPQNVLVGVDGVARMVDFGVAKAASRIHSTREGKLKGKLSYMCPEQISEGTVDRRSDVFSAGIVLWEALTGERLFTGALTVEVIERVVKAQVDPPSGFVPDLPPALDDVVLCALARDPEDRFATARAMAMALQHALPCAPSPVVGDWVRELAAATLAEREKLVAEMESASPQQVSMPPLGTISVLEEERPATVDDRGQRGSAATDQLSDGDVETGDDPEIDAVPPTPIAGRAALQSVASLGFGRSGEEAADGGEPSTRPRTATGPVDSAAEPSTLPRAGHEQAQTHSPRTKLSGLHPTQLPGSLSSPEVDLVDESTAHATPEALRMEAPPTQLSADGDGTGQGGGTGESKPGPDTADKAAASTRREAPVDPSAPMARTKLSGDAATRISWPIRPTDDAPQQSPAAPRPAADDGTATKPGLGFVPQPAAADDGASSGETISAGRGALRSPSAAPPSRAADDGDVVSSPPATRLSAAHNEHPEAARSFRRAVGIVVAIVALVGVAALVLAWLRPADPAPASKPMASSEPSPAGAGGTAATPAASAAAGSTAVPADSTASSPAATAGSAATGTGSRAAPLVGSGRVPSGVGTATGQPPPRPSTPPAGDCDPPYVVGADGVKVFKKHCFK